MNEFDTGQRISATFARNPADTIGKRPRATLLVIPKRPLASGILLLALACLALSGCTPGSAPLGLTAPVSAHAEPVVSAAGLCQDRFITHELPHNTTTADGVIRQYEANGAGARHQRPGTMTATSIWFSATTTTPISIFWNEGGLRFRQGTDAGRTHARRERS